jgi:hypothetical protein
MPIFPDGAKLSEHRNLFLSGARAECDGSSVPETNATTAERPDQSIGLDFAIA